MEALTCRQMGGLGNGRCQRYDSSRNLTFQDRPSSREDGSDTRAFARSNPGLKCKTYSVAYETDRPKTEDRHRAYRLFEKRNEQLQLAVQRSRVPHEESAQDVRRIEENVGSTI